MTGFDRLTTQLVAALRAHLAGGRPSVPEAGRPLWRAFCDLAGTRTWYAHGPNPITFAEIEAWCRVMREPLQPHHVEVIRALDAAWLEHARGQLATPEKDRKRAVRAPSGQELTPALFDAVLS